jgi:hypothetical protein
MEFWFGNLLERGHLKGKEEDGRITLRWGLGKYVVETGNG